MDGVEKSQWSYWFSHTERRPNGELIKDLFLLARGAGELEAS